jgi:cell division septation protein DedD
VTPPAPTAPAAPDPAAAPAKALPPAPSERFAVEFGPFLTGADAERVERQLTQAGYQTARFRQSQTGANLYAVLLERIPAGRDPESVSAALREQGFADPAVVGQDPPVIRLGDLLPLRGAVELAERARALGHPVRVAAQPGEPVTYMIRHGNFVSRQEAAEKAEEFGHLGLAYQVIQVR